MGLNNGTADGESHAHAARLGGVERVKDLAYVFGSRPGPRVFDRYLHLIRINVPGGDQQFPWPLTYTAHSFDRIHDQVQHHLLQLNPIARNR